VTNRETKKKRVLIGNGMAGIATLEQILKLTRAFDITVYGSEPYPNYNRMNPNAKIHNRRRLWIFVSLRDSYSLNFDTASSRPVVLVSSCLLVSAIRCVALS